MTGSPVWCHVFDDLYRGGLQRKVRHDKADGCGKAAEESKWFSDRGIKRHVQRLGSAGGIGKFQMPGITDIEFSGIFFGVFQCDLYGAAHIRDTVAADDDKVSVSAQPLVSRGSSMETISVLVDLTASSAALICPAAPVRELNNPKLL